MMHHHITQGGIEEIQLMQQGGELLVATASYDGRVGIWRMVDGGISRDMFTRSSDTVQALALIGVVLLVCTLR